MPKKQKPKKLCGASGQLTAKGTPCTNPVKNGSDRCGTHGSDKSGAPPKKPNDIYGTVDGKKQTYTRMASAYASIGMTKYRTARVMQMAPTLLRSWWERGEADNENDVASQFRDFYLQFEAGRSKFVANQLQRMNSAADGGDWRAADAMLKLVLKEEFGPHATVEHTGNVNIVQQHADQFIEPLLAMLGDLGVAEDPRVPDLIEKYFTPLERPAEI